MGTTEFFDERPGQLAPKIGDVRVRFEVVKTPRAVTIIAAQKGKNFADYTTETTKREISYVVAGLKTADQVFGAAHQKGALFCQRHAARAAQEQRMPKFAFEFDQPHRQCGLRDVERFGRAGEIACACDGEKVFQGPDVHVFNYSTMQ